MRGNGIVARLPSDMKVNTVSTHSCSILRYFLRYFLRYSPFLFAPRSGIDSTSEVAPDLEPALRLALGAPLSPLVNDDGAPLGRFHYLCAAWNAAQANVGDEADSWEPPQSVILDGELLVYDERHTTQGKYDELGSLPGIVGFGTHFWVSVTPDVDGEMKGGRYSCGDCRRHYMVKVRSRRGSVPTDEWPQSPVIAAPYHGPSLPASGTD